MKHAPSVAIDGMIPGPILYSSFPTSGREKLLEWLAARLKSIWRRVPKFQIDLHYTENCTTPSNTTNHDFRPPNNVIKRNFISIEQHANQFGGYKMPR